LKAGETGKDGCRVDSLAIPRFAVEGEEGETVEDGGEGEDDSDDSTEFILFTDEAVIRMEKVPKCIDCG
jgi:hypothetical protein